MLNTHTFMEIKDTDLDDRLNILIIPIELSI